MGCAGFFQSLHGGERQIVVVAVVNASAAVEAAVAHDGRPGAEAFAPAFGFRLLVEMAVEECRLALVAACGGNADEERGRNPRLFNDFEFGAGQEAAAPFGRILKRTLQNAVGLPVGIEGAGLGGNADEVLQAFKRVAHPRTVDGFVDIGRERHEISSTNF